MKDSFRLVITALVCVFVIGGCCMMYSGRGGSGYTPREPDDERAARCGRLLAEQNVPRFLKAPASAQFPREGISASRLPNGHWLASGNVDSHNLFGALIRARWEMEIFQESNGDWNGEWIEIDGDRVWERTKKNPD